MIFNPVSYLNRAWHYLTGGSWRKTLAWFATLGCVFAAGGFLFAWLGLVPVAASSGHWRVTEWLLRFTMSNSVATRSLGIDAPPLEDPALALRAAGHYATGCEPCHGAPGKAQSPIVDMMTPKPPTLPLKVEKRTPEQLFWIVKHGIKYTAMPGWVALQREDEVWAMVAFLLRLPQITPDEYRRLAYGEPVAEAVSGATGDDAVSYLFRPLYAPLELILADCARCHGPDGNGRGLGAFPKLAGQNETYLLASLQAYASGARHSGIMEPVAAALSEASLRALARHYSTLAFSAMEEDPDLAAVERGRVIAVQGAIEQGVPSCIDCHGPQPGPRNPLYPRLAGQYPGYLALQLELFKAGTRGGTPYAHIMNSVASRLTAAQIRDLAAYYAALGDDAEKN
jgi:cytochrome c553